MSVIKDSFLPILSFDDKKCLILQKRNLKICITMKTLILKLIIPILSFKTTFVII
jgi:hypothetical protein